MDNVNTAGSDDLGLMTDYFGPASVSDLGRLLQASVYFVQSSAKAYQDCTSAGSSGAEDSPAKPAP